MGEAGTPTCMSRETDIDDVRGELATAVGLVALADAPLHEAAQRAGVSRWELEECLESHSLAETLDVRTDADVGEEIDRVLDEHHS